MLDCPTKRGVVKLLAKYSSVEASTITSIAPQGSLIIAIAKYTPKALLARF